MRGFFVVLAGLVAAGALLVAIDRFAGSRVQGLFRILAGFVAVGALFAAILMGFAARGWGQRVLSVAFFLLPAVFFGRVALTGAGLSERPYAFYDDFEESDGDAKSENEDTPDDAANR